MYPELHPVSGVSLVDGIYGVYVDMVKFFILWVHLHCYDCPLYNKCIPL